MTAAPPVLENVCRCEDIEDFQECNASLPSKEESHHDKLGVLPRLEEVKEAWCWRVLEDCNR